MESVPRPWRKTPSGRSLEFCLPETAARSALGMERFPSVIGALTPWKLMERIKVGCGGKVPAPSRDSDFPFLLVIVI